MVRKPKIGLALCAGGARGWCHFGALRVLDEIGIEVDVIAGPSMGALVGALVGAAHAGRCLDALEAWVRGLSQTKLVTLMDQNLTRGGLVEARQIETMLGEIGLSDRIEDLDLPFTAIATDMETGREVWMSDGPAYGALRASAGMPGVMSPARPETATAWQRMGSRRFPNRVSRRNRLPGSVAARLRARS